MTLRPSSSVQLSDAAESLKRAIRGAGRGLVARDWLVELVCLAAVAREHVLVIGPAGTAKSQAVRRVAHALSGQYFEYLLGRFTEPSEIYGPVDLQKLREGVVQTVTSGMLPEAEIAFLDELFLGSTAILNTLLGILNERVFRRGHVAHACNLRICVAASNALPADESLAALADRFLVRAYVHPVSDGMLEQLLEAGFTADEAGADERARLSEVDLLAEAVKRVDLGPVRGELAEALRTLRNAGIDLSDRRAVRSQRLIAAATVISGRMTAGPQDLWPLLYAVPHEADQLAARELLGTLLSRSESSVLPSSAEKAALSRASLAARLVRDVEELLAHNTKGETTRAHRLRIEALGREIDAGFAPAHLTDALREARARLSEALA